MKRLTRDAFAAALQALGIRPGDIVHVQSDLMRIGPVDAPTDRESMLRFYLDGLLAAVGPDGTLTTCTAFEDYGRYGTPFVVVPSWDLNTLWVTNNAEGRTDGSLTPIDPKTAKPGKDIPVDDPYYMYFTPDGNSAIVVAEARKRLDFRDPQTMKLQYSIEVPDCPGVNHVDFSIDGTYAIYTCEFGSALAKVSVAERNVLGYLKLRKGAMPQDIRSIRAVTARNSMSPIAVRNKSTMRPAGGAVFQSSISKRARSSPTGRFPAAEARKWVMSAQTASCYGFLGASTTWCTRSIQ